MHIINYILLHFPVYSDWGYVLIFVSALAEAMPVVGSIFPGHTIIIISGGFAQMGFFDLWLIIVLACTGAIIGDLIAYLVGFKYGQSFIFCFGKYFFFDQAKYEKTKELVREHAGKTLIIGRYSAFTRAFAPFIAGISRVKFGKFIFYDILGGITWGTSSVLIGYIFGAGFETAGKYFGRFIAAAVIAIILLVFGYRFLNKRRHVFAKYHVYYLAMNAFAIYIFSKMAEDYFGKESTYRLDLWFNQNIHLLWQPWLNKPMIFITNVFSPEVLLAAASALAVFFYFKKEFHRAGLLFLSSAGGLALGAITKILVSRPRPLGGLTAESGFSFPSQHALMALIFFSCLMFIYLEKINNKPLKYLFIAGNILMILLVGFSRLYLKVHYLSDVLAGFAMGLFWFTFLILVFRITISLTKDYPWLQKFKK